MDIYVKESRGRQEWGREHQVRTKTIMQQTRHREDVIQDLVITVSPGSSEFDTSSNTNCLFRNHTVHSAGS